MLIPQGEVVYQNLYTAFTDVDHLINELETHQITGYCLMSSPTYEGAVLFDSKEILNGIECIGGKTPVVQTGALAIAGFLTKAREKGEEREISVYKIPESMVMMLAAALHATSIHENLSTEFTSLDKLIAVQQKNALSGYIEMLFEGTSGAANIFFSAGKVVQSIFAPTSSRLIAGSISFEELMAMCRTNRAVFNVYQSGEGPRDSEKVGDLAVPVPQNIIILFGQILAILESVADHAIKKDTFTKTLKASLPPLANQYEFFDPFVGDFRYANRSLSFEAGVTYKEFLDGMCALVNAILTSLFESVPQNTLLPQISRAIEPVSLAYSELIDQLHLKTCMPEIFQDYSYLKEAGLDGEDPGKLTEKQLLLNLRGVENPNVGYEEMLQEFYHIIALLHERYTDQEGKNIYYTKFKSSQEYKAYQSVTALLQKFDLASLQDRNARLAFWLNVYNFMTIDGVLGFGVKTDVKHTNGFFNKSCYLLGKHIFSLDDIEHGILRNNHRHPYTLFRQFNNTDTRKTFCINPLESRIHCCLVCAAKSSPPLVVYSPETLETQLEGVTDYFLKTHGMQIDLEKSELWLDRTFYWYRKDFEQQEGTLMNFIISAVQDEPTKQTLQENSNTLKLRFMDYDWNLNGE